MTDEAILTMKSVNMKYIYLSLIMGLLTLMSCNKDFETEGVTSTTRIPGGVTVIGEVDGSIIGYVYNDQGDPVPGANVYIYNNETTTSDLGVFEFVNVKLDPNGTYIQAVKNGYMLGSDKVYPREGELYSSIQMIQLRTDKSFVASEGGSISMDAGGSVTFAPNSIRTESGDDFQGEVFVTARFISPSDKDISDLMPGDLVADDAEGRTVVLATGGMAAVELRSANGEELNLKEGSTATILMPYTDGALPETIKLWSFDEEKGRWQEEGRAQREGDNYVAVVSHFSFWNCDVPYPLIQLCGRVVTESGEPVRTKVYIKVDGIGTGHGYTDSNGEFCGKVPKGEELEVTVVRTFCSGDQVTQISGPHNDDVVLDEIVLNDYAPNLSGEVVCNGEPYDDVTILFQSNLGTYVISPRMRSTFNLNLNIFCDDLTNATIQAINNNTNLLSSGVDVDLANPDFYTIEVCEDPCDFTGEVIVECGVDTIGIVVTGSSGNFSYIWSTGDSSQYIGITSNQLATYCVTVTETTQGCDETYCTEAVAGDFSMNLFYDVCNQFVDVSLRGGVPPYEVTGDATETLQNSFGTFFPTRDGDFCIDVTDALGCVVTGCVDVTFDDIPFVESRAFSCSDSIYRFGSSFYEFGQLYDDLGNSWNVNSYPLDINVLETGFSFKRIFIQTPAGCGAEFPISVPFFSGITEVIPLNTSCAGCLDGGLEVTIDPNADCFACEYGSYIVIDARGIDVTNSATQGTLAAGNYTVIALDANTSCYIDARRFVID